MKLNKFIAVLFVSVVASFAVLPSVACAQSFNDSAFTPDKATGNDITHLKTQLEAEKKVLAKQNDVVKAADKNLDNYDTPWGTRRQAKKWARGDDNSFDEKLNKMTPEARAAAQRYANEYKKLETSRSKIVQYENSIANSGNLYYTTTGEGDNEEKIYFTKNADGTYTAMGGVTEGCQPLPAKLSESQQCIFCPLFTVLFNAANDMATKSFAGLAGPITKALFIGFAIYIAFRVLFLVSNFTKQDGPKFVTELLTQSFKVFVAILLLTQADYIYEYAISPLLQAGLEFGSSLLFSRGQEVMQKCLGEYGGRVNIGTIVISDDGVMPASLYMKLHCFVLSIQEEIGTPMAIGSSLMCISTHAAGDKLVAKIKIPDFSMLFQGLIIWVFSLLVTIAFAFYLIDATVRIGIVGALLPFLIATWPFKITSKYANTGFTMLMNSFFVYVFAGIVVSVNIQLMGNALGGPGGFDTIQEKINGNNVQELKDLLDMGAAGFLILIGCCLFGFKLTNQSSALADNMAGGGGGEGIGNKIGGLAASGVTGAAVAGRKVAASGARAGVGAVKGAKASRKAAKSK